MSWGKHSKKGVPGIFFKCWKRCHQGVVAGSHCSSCHLNYKESIWKGRNWAKIKKKLVFIRDRGDYQTIKLQLNKQMEITLHQWWIAIIRSTGLRYLINKRIHLIQGPLGVGMGLIPNFHILNREMVGNNLEIFLQDLLLHHGTMGRRNLFSLEGSLIRSLIIISQKKNRFSPLGRDDYGYGHP